MENALLKYLNERMRKTMEAPKMRRSTPGPVITISREVGCNGLVLARKLAARLNQQATKAEWKVLSKEVFYKSAKELDIAPETIRKTLKKVDKYTFEEILNAFGNKRYKSNAKIIKTVRDVVYSLSEEGFNIIVGRASHIIAHDLKKALHLRLIAPMDYRVTNIMANNDLSKTKAIDFIQKVEQERQAFRKAMNEDEQRHDYFDLTINRASFSTEQIIELIIKAIDKKQLLCGCPQDAEYL